ncbi:hypothetical protein F2Q68_00045749 [Brassica cretica]|uniref:Myb-like domain-containing protein n=1 Tax=Brassica cretica TaxID=69181 RepID=A0A8S9LUT3_BRACR|nr:hypothetical protein F2Q68_00045749 [Brassica cretica]
MSLSKRRKTTICLLAVLRDANKRRRVLFMGIKSGNMDGSRHSGWLSETKINGVCCSGSGDGWMKTHDPGSPDQRRTLVDRDSSLSSSQVPTLVTDDVGERQERRKWTPNDDVLLIISWLNTSKDPVVRNEQRSGSFWTRIAAYYAASPKAAGSEEREPGHCKQRWHKINDSVCKFCGSYEAVTREKTSGCNENDVLKRAHEIFYNNEGNSKKRKAGDGADSSSSQAIEPNRPAGVKAEKACGKKTMVE